MQVKRQVAVRLGLGLALILAIVAAVYWIARPAPQPTVRLPDGREITFLKATYGKEHRHVEGRPWIKVLAPFMGAGWGQARGLRVAVCGSPEPRAVFWFRFHNASGPGQMPTLATIVDEWGNSTEPVWITTSANTPGGDIAVAWSFDSYPRRSRSLTLRVVEPQTTGLPRTLAEFRVKNPGPQRFPALVAEPFPAKRSQGDLDFTLCNLVAGKPRPLPRHLLDDPQRSINWSIALFQVRERGQPAPSWRVGRLRLSDATGNLCETKTQRSETVGDFLWHGFDGMLWPQEAAWRVTAEFVRASGFASNEVASLPTLELPTGLATTNWTNLNYAVAATRIVRIEFQRYFGAPVLPGRFRPTGFLRLELAPELPRETWVTLIQAEDDLGHAVPNQPGYSGNSSVRCFELDLLLSARKLSVTVAVQRSRIAEFVVKPNPGQGVAPAAREPSQPKGTR